MAYKIAMFSLTSVHSSCYINGLPLCDKFEWVAVSVDPKDRSKTMLDYVAPGVKIYESEEEVLDAHPDLDAVLLSGANYQTFDQFMLCANRGIKNIFMMKVPTFDMEKYAQMQAVAKEKGIVVQIELEMRFDATVRNVKKIIDEGKIGKVISIQMNNTTVCLQPDLAEWVTNPQKSYGEKIKLCDHLDIYRGGCLTDHPHAFDLARMFTDSEFDTIYADACENFREGREVEEGVFVMATMKNGVKITIDPSYSRHEYYLSPQVPIGPGWEGYPKRVEFNIVVVGENGCILADCFHSGVYHTGLPNHTYAVQYVSGAGTGGDHYAPTLEAFAECIKNRSLPKINLELHKDNMRAVNACYESIKTGKVIKMD